MSSRSRQPLSLPPPPVPTSLATPPTSPELSPSPGSPSFAQRIEPGWVSPTQFRSGSAGLGLGFGELGMMGIGGDARGKTEKENKLKDGNRFLKKLRSVRSVPLLSNNRVNKSSPSKKKDGASTIGPSSSINPLNISPSRGKSRNPAAANKAKDIFLTPSINQVEMRPPVQLAGRKRARTRVGQDVFTPGAFILKQPKETDSPSSEIVSLATAPLTEEGDYESINLNLGRRGSGQTSLARTTSLAMARRGRSGTMNTTETGRGSSDNGGQSPRSTLKLMDPLSASEWDDAPRGGWDGRSSEASGSIGRRSGRGMGSLNTVDSGRGSGESKDREEVYRSSRDLQRVMGTSEEVEEEMVESLRDSRYLGETKGKTVAEQGDEDDEGNVADISNEGVRDSEEFQQKFLNRHSRDFGHLYRSPLAGLTEDDDITSPVASTSAEAVREQQQQSMEEARRLGREKRRSFMLAKAGLAGVGSPLNSIDLGGPSHRRNSSSVSMMPMSPGFAMSPTATTDRTPRPQTVLRGGVRPLSLVLTSQHEKQRRLSLSGSEAEQIVLGPPLMMTSPITDTVLEEGDENGDESIGTSGSSNSLALDLDRSGGRTQPYISHAKHWSLASTGRLPRRNASKRNSSLSSSSGSISAPNSAPLLQRENSQAHRALPPHLRHASTSTHSMTNSSLSSLGAILNGQSESSCSSGGDTLGGPKMLSPDAYNFRMSLTDRSNRNSRRDSVGQARPDSRMTTSTYATHNLGSLRTESRLTSRGVTPSFEMMADPEREQDREGRIQRRRARAFLVAGLKLEQSSAGSSSGKIIAEQLEPSPTATSQSIHRKERRAGLLIEGDAGIGRDPIEALKDAFVVPIPEETPEPSSRKRYSLMRKEKVGTVPLAGDDHDTALPKRAGTPLLPLYLQPERPSTSRANTQASGETVYYTPRESPVMALAEPLQHVSSEAVGDVSNGSQGNSSGGPGITVSMFGGNQATEPAGSRTVSPSQQLLVPGMPRNESERSLHDPSTWHDRNSGEMVKELFWVPGMATNVEEPEPIDGTRLLRKVKSDFGLRAAFQEQEPLPRRSMSRPPTPNLVVEDAAGASPGRIRKNSWSKTAREWLRPEAAETPETEVEKGFGFGRGGDTYDQADPLTVNRKAEAAGILSVQNQASSEKKSWRRFLGSGRRKRRGSLPDVFMATTPDVTSIESPIIAPSPVHVRRSTEPYSQVSYGTNQFQQTPSPTTLTPPTFPSQSGRMQPHHFSPLSAASYSPQTPLYHSMSSGMRDHNRTPLISGVSTELSSSLSPTPRMQYANNPSFSSHTRSDPTLPPMAMQVGIGGLGHHFHSATTPKDRSRTALHGLGFDPVLPSKPTSTWKGKAKASSQEQEASERKFAQQAANLVKLSNSHPAAPRSPVNLGFSTNGTLGRRPDLGVRSHSNPEYSPPANDARDVSGSSGSQTLLNQGRSRHGRQEPEDFDAFVAEKMAREKAQAKSSERPRSPRQQEPSTAVLIRHDTRLLPAKLFFLLGFLLGPWVWLFGGWALSPAGHFVSAGQIPRGVPHRPHHQGQESAERSPRKGLRKVLPSINRDRPEKWVKRNRIAAVVSSALVLPAMCVGFGYLGHLL